MAPGQLLAHYRIERRLGAGGMGVVYQALDSHLNRTVAIKVLLPEAVADPVRRQRFVQEARAASAIDHPHIVTIYDIAEAAGEHFIVMQYVDGRTLRELLPSGLALSDTLRYAVQMADALAQAHARGIIHRDLKPENIMIAGAEGQTGQVKVLDFGLAKLAEPVAEAAPGDQLAPTLSASVGQAVRTEEGMIVGTVAYMSPEQAEGKKVDARTDIFSFGSLLYEMITSRRAFQGETRMSTLAAILHQEPARASGIVPGLPPELEKILLRCLRKDRDRRYQHMDDIKLALEELREDSDAGRLAAPPALVTGSRRLLFAGILLGVAVTSGVAWWLGRSFSGSRPASYSAPALTRLTSDAGLTDYPTLSRDGKLLAYASDRSGEGNLDIWLQQVGGGAPIRLTRHEADDTQPAFSPDGTKIVFRSGREDGGIYLISTLGGSEQRVADQGRNPRYSPDGNWIAYWVGDLSYFSPRRMYVVGSAGTQPRQLQPNFFSASYPLWSPDGKYLLFLGISAAKAPGPELFDWWVTPLEGGPAVRSGAYKVLQQHGTPSMEQQPGDWFGNHIFYSSVVAGETASLWRVALSPGTWRLDGSPLRVTSGAAQDQNPSVAARGASGAMVVFASQNQNEDLWSLAVDSSSGKVSGEPRRITVDAATDNSPSPSMDGKKLAFLSFRAGNIKLWIKDLEAGTEVGILDSRSTAQVIMTPDGSRVAYANFDNVRAIYTGFYVVATQGGVSREFCADCAGPLQDWWGDDRKVLYKKGLTADTQLLLRDIDSGEETVFLKHPKYNLTAARFSSDRRWMTFQSVLSPQRRQLFITPVRDAAAAEEKEWIPITDGTGLDRNAVWSPDGSLLYYLSERDGSRCLWAQRLEPSTKRPQGPAFPVYHFHQARRSLMFAREMARINLSITRDKIIFSMAETTGNIWMTQVEGLR